MIKPNILYDVKIPATGTATKWKKLGYDCKVGDVLSIEPSILMQNGSTIRIECVCDRCNKDFTRQARRIKEVLSGDKHCASCASILTHTGRIKTEDELARQLDTSIKFWKSDVGIALAKERCIKGVATKKTRVYVRENTARPDFENEGNPAWNPNKTQFELFQHYCEKVKERTIKEQNIQRNSDEYICYKISIHTAFKLGMSPEYVGSRLVVIERSEYKCLLGLGNNHGIHQTIKRRSRDEMTSLSAYRCAVQKITEQTYKDNLSALNPNNKIRGKQLTGNDNHHLDHIVPVIVCFENNIPAKICGSLQNLQLIHWRENIKKNDRMNETNKYMLEQFKQLSGV